MANILIVDDSNTQRTIMAKILTKQGYEVCTAANGLIGVQAAQYLMPDLILMDIAMPEMDGFQATRIIKKNPETRHIPIIMISSTLGENDCLWGLRHGACDFIAKPFQQDAFLHKINSALGHYSSMNSYHEEQRMIA